MIRARARSPSRGHRRASRAEPAGWRTLEGSQTAESARGRDVATALCEHVPRELSDLAMQVNCVVATNKPAVRLWTKLGFETVGRRPRTFRRPSPGLVDVLSTDKRLGG